MVKPEGCAKPDETTKGEQWSYTRKKINGPTEKRGRSPNIGEHTPELENRRRKRLRILRSQDLGATNLKHCRIDYAR